MEKKLIDITEEDYVAFETETREQMMAAESEAGKKYYVSKNVGELMARVVNREVYSEGNDQMCSPVSEEQVNQLVAFLDRLKAIVSGMADEGLLTIQPDDLQRLILGELFEIMPLFEEDED